MSAGMLLFVNHQVEPIVQSLLDQMNQGGRISPEVLSLHLATPTREAVRQAAADIKQYPSLQSQERIQRLKPNNAVRDLTAPWRLSTEFVETHKLLLNLETVNPEFRYKYPDPNLTLPAGGIENGEESVHAAHRELFEEARVKVDPSLVTGHIGLFRNGMHMYCVVITALTPVTFIPGDRTLYIGDLKRIQYFYNYISGRPISPLSQPTYHNSNFTWHNTPTFRDFNTKPTSFDSKRHGERHLQGRSYQPTFNTSWMTPRVAPAPPPAV